MNFNSRYDLNSFIHFIMGILCAIIPQILYLWLIVSIIFFGFLPFFSKTKKNDLPIFAFLGYLVSMEMMVRMSELGLPHEMMKYLLCVFFLIGLIKESSRPKPLIIIVYMIFLLPSILVMKTNGDFKVWRDSISFNLSGPLALTFSCVYFFQKKISVEDLILTLKCILLPIVSTVGYLFINTPNVSEVSFTHNANFALSGYGPNQMSSLFGVGILVILIGFIFNLNLFNKKFIGQITLLLLVYRGLLTFSRGGMLSPIIAIFVAFIYYTYKVGLSAIILNKIKLLSISILFLSLIFIYVNSLTGNILLERYSGKRDGEFVDLKKYSSGRSEIQEIDFEIFADNLILGVGPGMAKELRVDYGYAHETAAHNEISRLFAEHGIFGLMALILLFIFPISQLFNARRNLISQFILIVGVIFCFGFFMHSATRIAIPMFLYGFGFAYFENKKLSNV
jgi:O-antigen ligase